MCDYNYLMNEITKKSKYVHVGCIGKSTFSRAIPYVFIGEKTKKSILIQGSIHAREHITTDYLLLEIERLMQARKPLGMGIYIVPMVNVDGVELALKGLGSVASGAKRIELLKINQNSLDFSMFKANCNGVDLNNNFDARWASGVCGAVAPAPCGYPGEYAASEVETVALCAFTKMVKPCVTVSYHSKGEVIFWDFFQKGKMKKQSYELARLLSKATGYELVPNGDSVGGYKDWCIDKLKILAYTIEIGSDDICGLVPQTELGKIFNQNINNIDIIKEFIHGEE